MPIVATQQQHHNATLVAEPAPVFPPGAIFTVSLWDEHYDRGHWREQFPRRGYPIGVSTARLAELTAEKYAAAEAYRDRHWTTCQSEIWVTHPALGRREFAPNQDGARAMWDALRELGIVPFDYAA